MKKHKGKHSNNAPPGYIGSENAQQVRTIRPGKGSMKGQK